MPVITTGVPHGRTVSRLELRNFLKDKDLTNLYLLAMDRMQRKDQNSPTSWYQLASIHGRPYKPWDNVEDENVGEKHLDEKHGRGKHGGENHVVQNHIEEKKVGKKGRSSGYCTHSSVLFPSWHRPYLALFEQVLSKHVFKIANQYTNPVDKKRYLAAAERFRVPYWDWAVNPELPHIVAVDETVVVHAPNGVHTIKNPLHCYNFNPVYKDFGDGGEDEEKWETWQSTVRYPTSKTKDVKSQPAAMQKELESKYHVLRDKTYILLTQATDYGAFSNDSHIGPEQDPISYNNIESIHNDIHGFAGEDGHMGTVDYAAFDPIFWLHHANVDRLFAIWQALHPDAYVCPQNNPTGTWTRNAGTETAETPLTPFRISHDKFWDSNGVRSTHTFKYTYPELRRWSSKSSPTTQQTDHLQADIIRLYGSPVVERLIDAFHDNGENVASIPQPVPLDPSPASKSRDKAKFEIIDRELPENHWHNTIETDDDKLHYHEWLANMVVKKYEVNASFFVRVFLGKPNNDPAQWGLDPNLVGSQAVFANNATVTGCGNCRVAEANGQLVTGTIPLTSFLGDRMGESNLPLEPEQIIPYLEENFTWAVQKLDGTVIDVPSLKISIAHAIVEIPETGSARTTFPTWSPLSMHMHVTADPHRAH